MRSLFLLLAVVAPTAAADPVPDFATVKPLLQKYCANCHNAKKAQGELNLAPFTDEAAALKARKVWVDVHSRVTAREMPPDDAAQPTAHELELLTKWSAEIVKRIDATTPPQPGRVTMRRLNRVEYRNTVRDLFGIQFDLTWDPTRDFPGDGAGYGFDNIGDVLTTSPLLMERYLIAAGSVIDRATGMGMKVVPESYGKLFIANPSDAKSRKQAAGEILAAFLPRAFRRPVPKDELAKYVAVFEKADRPGEPFEVAMTLPLKAALVSPHFLYRIETDRPAKDGSYPLSPYELASRLSYFLWSSMPDAELFKVAADGTLSDRNVLEAQTKRMLADPKADALAENFVPQWLQIRGLDNFQPEKRLGQIGTRLRLGMANEPVRLFREVLSAGLPVRTLIDADFTFANADLAKHYKLEPVPEHADKQKQIEKDKILRYELPIGSRRGGIASMAAVLVTTSHPDRTSPVKRGKWVLDALLGAPPPPPPPSVEALKEVADPKVKLTLRQRLEAHRSDATCASCHKRMDPLGFAFENYDALGRWRDKDGNIAVDASATLPDGAKIDGVPGLKAHLLKEHEVFTRNVINKMLTYALGRGIEPFDNRAIDSIADAVKKDDDRLSRIVLGIVTSQPFRYRSLPETSK